MRYLLVAILVLPYTAFSADWYAAPSGSGSACTLGTPCSVATAMSTAQPGDTVYLTPGTYTTTGSVPIIASVRHGTNGNPIRVTHSGARLSAVLDGTGSTASGINLYHSYHIIDGLELVNIYGNGIAVDGDNNGSTSAADYGHNRANARHYYANGADGNIVRNCYIHSPQSTNDMIRGSRTNNYLVEDNEIAGATGNSNAIDLVGAYNATIRGNYIHDGVSISVFAKGGSENIVVENNRFVDASGNANATLSLGQTTEWYNTRYTAASISSAIHDALLEWTGGDSVNSVNISGTATGGSGSSLVDSGASFSSAQILVGATVWKRAGSFFCGYGIVQSVDSATQITFSGPMTEYHASADCTGVSETFGNGDLYQIDDPIDDFSLYNGATMAECRNCVARNNVIVGGPLPLQAQNCYNCDFYNNTCINSGTNQGWVKLWNDDAAPSYWHPSENVKVVNNIFYNDADHALAFYGFVQDKQAGGTFPGNVTGFASDYNLLYDATDGGTPAMGHRPGGNDTNSIFAVPDLDAGRRPAGAASNVVGIGYDVAADASSLISTDASGYNADADEHPRPVGAWDIGAYEYQGVVGAAQFSNPGTPQFTNPGTLTFQ